MDAVGHIHLEANAYFRATVRPMLMATVPMRRPATPEGP